MGKKKIKANKSKGKEGGKRDALLSTPVKSSQEFEGLAGFEEISSCTILKLSKNGKVKREIWEGGKIKKNKKKKKVMTLASYLESEPVSHSVRENKRKRKKKKPDSGSQETGQSKSEDVAIAEYKENIEVSTETQNMSEAVVDEHFSEHKVCSQEGKMKKRKKQQTTGTQAAVTKKTRYDNTTYYRRDLVGKKKVDVSAWEALFVPHPVMEALAELGFSQPTEIQRLVLPAAIKGRMDIIGAAETGSGKTLAFGIPIIHGILHDKQFEAEHYLENVEDSGVENSDLDEEEEFHIDEENSLEEQSKIEEINDEESDEAIVSQENLEVNENCEDVIDSDTSEDGEKSHQNFEENLGCVKVINDIDFDFLEEEKDTRKGERCKKKLRALIITPTRELAIQINSHLAAVLVHTDIRATVVVGGVAPQKQERLLRRGPEIVVGTPGRLWELIQQGNEHLAQVADIQYLAIDETDRMLERGHFQELTQLLELIKSNKSALEKRQTFVMSATLSIVHPVPKRLITKKKVKEMTSELKISELAKMTGVKPNPKIVDVTQKFGTAESLTEARINCIKEEKDRYLYYILKCYPGRTLVFCNSIDCVRRLQNLFTVLQCKPQSLHASLHQKKRLKSLEQFSSNPQALLFATDVAARGLDIPNIQHVIHYQVPRTAEVYIHRSGRTARASQEGLSILLIESAEVSRYHQLCKTLNRATDLPQFPVDINVMSQVTKRLRLASSIEKMEHTLRKTNAEKDWLRRTAQEAELLIEEEDYDDDHEREKSMKAAREKRDLQNKRAMLMKMLAAPFITFDFSGKYPTHTGSLVLPLGADFDQSNDKGDKNDTSNKALHVMKKESKEYSELLKKVKFKTPVRRLNNKKFKGSQKRKLKQKKRNQKSTE